MSRSFDPALREWLDEAAAPSVEVAGALDDLAAINRSFGGHRLLRYFLARWLNAGRCYRILDLCCGAGDLPRAMVAWAREREITLRIDAVDANPVILQYARERSVDFPEIHYHQGDALREAPGEGYDLAHCSLALHHFSDEDAARLLVRCREWSNRWALVSDLERHPLTRLGVQAAVALFSRNRLVRHDGPLSANRAFSFAEMRELAEAADWGSFGHARFLFCRQAVWLENRDAGDIPLTAAEMPGLA